MRGILDIRATAKDIQETASSTASTRQDTLDVPIRSNAGSIDREIGLSKEFVQLAKSGSSYRNFL